MSEQRLHRVAPNGKHCIVILEGSGISMTGSLYHGSDVTNPDPRAFVCRTQRRTLAKLFATETADQMIARLLRTA